MLTSYRTWKVKSALLLALVLTLLVAVPAFAAPPIIESGEYDYHHMSPAFQVCPGIEVWDHEVGTFHQTTYFDNQGNVRSVKAHFAGIDHFYNPENPGVVLSGRYSGSVDIDLATGDFINGRGAPVHIVVPGYGTVLIRAGFWSRYPQVQVAGVDSAEDPEGVAAFCSLLAGD